MFKNFFNKQLIASIILLSLVGGSLALAGNYDSKESPTFFRKVGDAMETTFVNKIGTPGNPIQEINVNDLTLNDNLNMGTAIVGVGGVDFNGEQAINIKDLKIALNGDIWAAIGRTNGYTFLGTLEQRGGFTYGTDEGGYLIAGDSDGNGNHCLSFISGSNFTKDHDCDTQLPFNTFRFYSPDDPDLDNQKFASHFHDGDDYNITTNTGNILLDPIDGQVVIDGFVNEGFSVQSLATGDTLQANARTVYVEGSGGVVTNTATPSISAGSFDGQPLKIIGDSANTYTLQDESSLSGSTLKFNTGANRPVVEFQTLNLSWSERKSKWLEDAYSPN